MLFELRVKRAGEPMTVVRVEKDAVIGRDSACDIVLQSQFVSRQHARLIVEHGACVVEDLGSRNGVFVNGLRVQGRRRLKKGDEIALSDCLLVYWEIRDEHSHTLPFAGSPVTEALRVDPELHEVWLGMQRVNVELTPAEFQLLEYLYQNRHRICATAEIGDLIWGSYAVGDLKLPSFVPNSVQVLVGRLRRKLKSALGRDDYILNVRGIGYRLDARPDSESRSVLPDTSDATEPRDPPAP